MTAGLPRATGPLRGAAVWKAGCRGGPIQHCWHARGSAPAGVQSHCCEYAVCTVLLVLRHGSEQPWDAART